MAQARPPIIYWIRRDFRVRDNPALSNAAAGGSPVIPVYVHDEALEGRPIGGAAKWWLRQTLKAFDASLASLGSRLIVRAGEAELTLAKLAAETGARRIVFNRLPEPDADARDERLTRHLQALGLEVSSYDADTLAQLGTVRTSTGGAYKVFTPFYRVLRAQIGAPALLGRPHSLPAPAAWPDSFPLDSLDLYPRWARWAESFVAWPGEDGAMERLDAFFHGPVAEYGVARDMPGVAGSSRMSPHLHWGEISPGRVLAAAEHAGAREPSFAAGAEKLKSELGWREFNRHLLWDSPSLLTRSFDARFERMRWRDDPVALEAWRRGRTGYPLVDAGMRELWVTGVMHNRVRMIVASFLIKHLLIDWRAGEAWFWDTLLDADLASNAGNWQWVAGSGADAAPFFRIFNPVAQGERFDEQGRYVRRWAPELARLPDRYVHAPWTAPISVLNDAGVSLGKTYPKPIVDHGFARARALEAFADIRPSLTVA